MLLMLERATQSLPSSCLQFWPIKARALVCCSLAVARSTQHPSYLPSCQVKWETVYSVITMVQYPRAETDIDRVDRMEDGSTDDELDIRKTVARSYVDLGSYVVDKEDDHSSQTADGDDSVTESESEIPVPKARTLTPSRGGELITWSSEDDVFVVKKKKKAVPIKRKRELISTASAKHPAKPSRASTRQRQRDWNDVGDNVIDDDEEDVVDGSIPSYLQDRRDRFDKAREHLNDAGLRLPPTYEGIDFSDDEDSQSAKEKPRFPKSTPVNSHENIELEYSGGYIPAPIAKWLRSYQVEGAAFMHEHFVYQRGGILGDDMGTGKTIQTIAFLTAAFGKSGDSRDAKRMRKMRRFRDRWYPRVLIICPGTLMNNWASELNTWGYWSIYLLHGSEKEAALQAAKSGHAEIILTTYKTYQLNEEAINMIQWDCVIADEFHQIKDRKSGISKSMNNINALCRIGLTGTAIQNNYDELWNLLNWTNPGRFGSFATWKESISLPLKMGQSHDASVAQLALARRTADKLVKNLLPRFFKRRTKALIADQLPKKSDRVVFCPLTDTQADAYQNLVDSDIVEGLRNSGKPCDCGSEKTRGRCHYTHIRGKKWQTWVFPSIVTLQKLCNHLAMIIPIAKDDAEKQDRELDVLRIACPDDWKRFMAQRDTMNLLANHDLCGKWAILSKLLKFWYEAGDKVLVFSHSVRLLRMLKMYFDTTSYNVSYLDGSMSYDERTEVVDDFNSNTDQFVFLISSRAGGVGLNITSANKVVVVDPHWNPSFDLQAQDRAYRIGQTRDVEVFRMISAGTIEEIVYARQIYKQQMANIGYNASLERRYFKGVQDQKNKKGEIFGLENMFAYQGEHVVLREIVNKTNIAESKANVLVTNIDISDDEFDDEDFGQQAEESQKSEDAALSQLADILVGKKKLAAKRKKDADGTEWILAQAGVEYSHENSEVIGTSKIESKLSRQAMERDKDIYTSNEHAFQNRAMLQVPKTRTSRGSSGEIGPVDLTDDSIMNLDEEFVELKFRPPESIRKRQFCSMANHFGFDSATKFAVVVEGWTQEQRRNCLDSFYKARRKDVLLPELKGE